LDKLKAGIEELDAAGVGAGRQIDLLVTALSGVGAVSVPGTVRAGGARDIGEAVAGVFFGSAVEALSDRILRDEYDVDLEADAAKIKTQQDKVDEAKRVQTANQQASPGRTQDSPAAKADAEAVKREEDELKKLSAQRDRAKGAALTDLKKFNPATGNQKELADLRTKVSDTVQRFIDGALPNGGVLTDAQLSDLATELAAIYVNEGQNGQSLEDTRKLLQVKLVEQLKRLTDPASLIVDQQSSDFVQQLLVGKASGAESEVALRSGDKVAGVRERLAGVNDAISVARRAGTEVSDTTLLALLQAERDLGDALSARASSFEDLAAAH
jgi:hypothetical protein